MADRLLDLATQNPAAAQEQAKQWGWWGKKGLTAAGVAALGAAAPSAINAIRPGTVPDYYNPVSIVTQGPEKVLAPKPLPPERAGPTVKEIPTDWSPPSPAASTETPAPAAEKTPAAPASDSAVATDAEIQDIIQQARKNKVDESTAALNRLVYLARL